MKHRGKMYEHVVRQSDMSLNQIAERLGVSRLTLYNYFGYANLNWDTVLATGKVIGHDFSKEFPELTNMVHDVEETYWAAKDKELDDCKREKEKYQKKYIEALEEIDMLRKENFDLKDRLAKG